MKPGATGSIQWPRPPMAGPSVKPMPNATPMSAMPRPRSSMGVTSAMYA